MVSRDDAEPLLKPLAVPTIAAITEAANAAEASQTAMAAYRTRASTAVRGMRDGVEQWSLLATFLAEGYANIAGVERESHTHPLSHRWVVNRKLRVQLKSDVHAVETDWLQLPGFSEVRSTTLPLVILTWHREPAFVHLTQAEGQVWKLPVAQLLATPTQTVVPAKRKAVVSSRRPKDSEQRNAGTQ